jgi:hypothetical protein
MDGTMASATVPRRVDVGAAMIAQRAEHAWLQVVEGHFIRKTADVQFGIVITVRIAATDEHAGSPEASHVRERHGFVVEQQVRDCLGHSPSKRGLSDYAPISGPVVFRGTPPQTPKVSLAVAAEVIFCRIRRRERRP